MSRPLTVVTGGGRGIGAATARSLAEAGHDLVLGYARDAEAAEATADRMRAQGASCRTVQADVSDPGEVDALFDAVGRDIAVNLTGAVLCARRAVPHRSSGLRNRRDVADGRWPMTGHPDVTTARLSPYDVRKRQIDVTTVQLNSGEHPSRKAGPR